MANNLHIHTPRFSIFAYHSPLPSIKAVSLEFQTNDLLQQQHSCAESLTANHWLQTRILNAHDIGWSLLCLKYQIIFVSHLKQQWHNCSCSITTRAINIRLWLQRGVSLKQQQVNWTSSSSSLSMSFFWSAHSYQILCHPSLPHHDQCKCVSLC